MKKCKTIPSGIIYGSLILLMIIASIATMAAHHTASSSSDQTTFTSIRNDLTAGACQKLTTKVITDRGQVHLRLLDGQCICGQCPIIPPKMPVLFRPEESHPIPVSSDQAKDQAARTTDDHTANQESLAQKQESSDPTQIGSQLPPDIKNPTSENAMPNPDNSQPREPHLPTSPSPTTGSAVHGPETPWSTLNFDDWGIAYDNTTGTYYYANSGHVYKITDQNFHADSVGISPDWNTGIKMTFVGNLS